jgi:hypothetical protein
MQLYIVLEVIYIEQAPKLHERLEAFQGIYRVFGPDEAARMLAVPYPSFARIEGVFGWQCDATDQAPAGRSTGAKHRLPSTAALHPTTGREVGDCG